MAAFYMKLGKLRVERSEKGDMLNFGLESSKGDGFFSIPLTARSALRAAGMFGATLAMRGVSKKLRKITRAQKGAQRRQAHMLEGFHPDRAGGKKRR